MKKNIQPPQSDIILYTTPKGDVRVEVFFQGETVWLTQKLMAELFDVDRSVITKHLKNILNEGELKEKSVSAKIAHTAADGESIYELFFDMVG